MRWPRVPSSETSRHNDPPYLLSTQFPAHGEVVGADGMAMCVRARTPGEAGHGGCMNSAAPAAQEWSPGHGIPRCKKRCASVSAVNRPKTLQNQQGFSRFGRPKSAPIVHRKHAGTVPLPHRCRAASATRAGVRIVMTLQTMLLNRDVLALDDRRADRAMRAGGRPCRA
jgi:hypothetical protein